MSTFTQLINQLDYVWAKHRVSDFTQLVVYLDDMRDKYQQVSEQLKSERAKVRNLWVLVVLLLTVWAGL
ncbi:MAG: hypothetical protein MN733_17085, partial [Nitrososphaera sp.]|nr:hypothetical protein [Nitrososphaera sp.]